MTHRNPAVAALLESAKDWGELADQPLDFDARLWLRGLPHPFEVIAFSPMIVEPGGYMQAEQPSGEFVVFNPADLVAFDTIPATRA